MTLRESNECSFTFSQLFFNTAIHVQCMYKVYEFLFGGRALRYAGLRTIYPTYSGGLVASSVFSTASASNWSGRELQEKNIKTDSRSQLKPETKLAPFFTSQCSRALVEVAI